MKRSEAQAVLKLLESQPKSLPGFAEEGTSVCLLSLDTTIGLLAVVADGKSSEEQVASVFLLTECVQEGLLGLHSARHGFASQVYAQCRAVREDTNLLRLFLNDRDELNRWIGAGQGSSRRLMPRDVRRKLGNEEPGSYAFYSEFGTHTTFDGLHLRGRLAEDETGNSIRVSFELGGDMRRDTSLPAFVALAFELHLLLHTAMAWSERIGGRSLANSDYNAIKEALRDFLARHFLLWASEHSIPTELYGDLLDLVEKP